MTSKAKSPDQERAASEAAARTTASRRLRRAALVALVALAGAATAACSSDDDGAGAGAGSGGAAGSAGAAAGAAGSAGAEPSRRAWYQFGFESPVLDQIVLHYLGQAWHQSADVGEVLETAGRVDEADPESWTREWRKTAERLGAAAQASEQGGHPLSAAQAYLRSATYYRAALHHHRDPALPEVRELAQREIDSFAKYLTLSSSPCKPVKIPYEATTLPGYFCASPAAKGPAPVLLFQEGRDGWAEDGRFIADEAMKRGMHVLLFDGPGMGSVIRLQGLPFRPDWDKVITPVVDYAVARSEVDPARVGLLSVSMGGYMGPQAASKEHRLKALIANPGVIDWSSVFEGFMNQLDPTLLPLVDQDEAAFNAKIQAYMDGSEFLRWGVVDYMWHHGVKTPAELVKDLRRYRMDAASVTAIQAHTLVVDAEAEEWGQSKALFDALVCKKDYLMFTAEETAQFHVQPGASGVASQRLLEWLELAL